MKFLRAPFSFYRIFTFLCFLVSFTYTRMPHRLNKADSKRFYQFDRTGKMIGVTDSASPKDHNWLGQIPAEEWESLVQLLDQQGVVSGFLLAGLPIDARLSGNTIELTCTQMNLTKTDGLIYGWLQILSRYPQWEQICYWLARCDDPASRETLCKYLELFGDYDRASMTIDRGYAEIHCSNPEQADALYENIDKLWCKKIVEARFYWRGKPYGFPKHFPHKMKCEPSKSHNNSMLTNTQQSNSTWARQNSLLWKNMEGIVIIYSDDRDQGFPILDLKSPNQARFNSASRIGNPMNAIQEENILLPRRQAIAAVLDGEEEVSFSWEHDWTDPIMNARRIWRLGGHMFRLAQGEIALCISDVGENRIQQINHWLVRPV